MCLRSINEKLKLKLYKILSFEKLPNKIAVQKRKFKFLNELVSDLFYHRNSIKSYKNISSLILLFLHFQNKIYPIEIYSRNLEDLKEKKRKCLKSILKRELLTNSDIST